MKRTGCWPRWTGVVPDKGTEIHRVTYPQDGAQIADLMEIGFGDLLDASSRWMLSGLRLWSGQGDVVWRLASALGLVQIGDWLDGLGAYDGKRLTGNVSLARGGWGPDVWMVGNVAVLPDHRRSGIARALMLAAMHEVRERGGTRVLLQVDEGNDAALRLYQDVGFAELARRSTWVQRKSPTASAGEEKGWQVRLRRDAEWRVEYELLQEMASAGLAWNVPLVQKRIRPSFLRNVENFLSDASEAHWLAWQGTRCMGVVISSMRAWDEQALLFCRPEESVAATRCLLSRMRYEGAGRRTITVEADSAVPLEVFEDLGFRLTRSLIWLERSLS